MNWKSPVLESLFNKFTGLKACNFMKTHAFSGEYCEIYKNSLIDF